MRPQFVVGEYLIFCALTEVVTGLSRSKLLVWHKFCYCRVENLAYSFSTHILLSVMCTRCIFRPMHARDTM